MLHRSAVLFVAKVIGYGMRILLPVFLVRTLSMAEFGLYAQFFLLETVTKTLFQLGSAQSLYYFVPRDPRNAGAYLLNSILLAVISLSLGFLVIALFRDRIVSASGLRIVELYLGQLAVYTVVMMVLTILEAYLTVRGWILATALWDIARQGLAAIATLVAAYVYRDLAHVILALVAVRVASMAGMIAYIHVIKRGFAADRHLIELKEQIRYGLVLGATGMLMALTLRVHELLVNRYYDLETYAVYAAGLRQIPIIQFFAQSVFTVALGRFAALEAAGDRNGIRALWSRILGGMYGVALPVTIVMLVVAGPLVKLMFTASYADAVPIFRWNCIAMLYLVLNPTLVLRAMDRNGISLRINAITLLALPFLLYGGMHTWGLQGVIATHAAALLGSRIATQMVLNRTAGYRLPYVASRQEVISFYARAWQAASRGVGARFGG